MSNQYIGEVRVFGFTFAPIDWAKCNGASIAISQNTTLFQIIGTTYGGDGVNTFALPNLQDQVVVGTGQGLGLRNWILGATFGEANHTLTINEVPIHTHQAIAGDESRLRHADRGADGHELLRPWAGRRLRGDEQHDAAG